MHLVHYEIMGGRVSILVGGIHGNETALLARIASPDLQKDEGSYTVLAA